MYAIPVAPSVVKLTWDSETADKVEQYKELHKSTQTISDIVHVTGTSDKESSRPPNSASTAVATEPYAILKIKTEANDVFSRGETPFGLSDPNSVYEFNDPDLTDIDDDDPSHFRDATVENRSDGADGGTIDGDYALIDVSEVNRRPTRRRCPTRRQTLLWKEPVITHQRDHSRRGHSLPAPPKSACMSTPYKSPLLLLRTSKQKETKTRKGHQGKQAPRVDFVERRISSRLQTAAMKNMLFVDHLDKDDDGDHDDTDVRPRSHKVAAQEIDSKLETEDNDVPDPDSWKAGWSKSDGWDKTSPKEEHAVKNEPITNTRNHLSVRTSLYPRRSLNGLRKSRNKTARNRRIECPKGCGKTFGRPHDAYRHADQTVGCGGGQRAFICPTCDGQFTRHDALKRHRNHAEHCKRFK